MLTDGEDTETLIDASLAFVVTHRTHDEDDDGYDDDDDGDDENDV